MAKRLTSNISSRYLEAANRLKSQSARRKIVAYVESYDDVFFWRTVLAPFENDKRYFEVMLPSHVSSFRTGNASELARGKKSVLMKLLEGKTGRDLIACVDADYDYLIAGNTPTSEKIVSDPYVFHTYAYAIENLQCYAPSLHNVCVAVTLNDRELLSLDELIRQYSQAIFPLFVWSIWHYRRPIYNEFSITDFNRVIELGGFNLDAPEKSIENVRRKVYREVSALQRKHPDAKESYLALKKELIEVYGVTPSTTYLYIQGHFLFDKIVQPILKKICTQLVREREAEIRHQSKHYTQMRNELSCYNHSTLDIEQMLKKNLAYTQSEPFRKIQADIQHFLESENNANSLIP